MTSGAGVAWWYYWLAKKRRLQERKMTVKGRRFLWQTTLNRSVKVAPRTTVRLEKEKEMKDKV